MLLGCPGLRPRQSIVCIYRYPRIGARNRCNWHNNVRRRCGSNIPAVLGPVISVQCSSALGQSRARGSRRVQPLIFTSRFRCKRRRWRVEAAWRRPLQKKNRSSGPRITRSPHQRAAESTGVRQGRAPWRRRVPNSRDFVPWRRPPCRVVSSSLPSSENLHNSGSNGRFIAQGAGRPGLNLAVIGTAAATKPASNVVRTYHQLSGLVISERVSRGVYQYQCTEQLDNLF
jgi:hypothetical protein